MPGCDGRHGSQRPEGAWGFPRTLLRCRSSPILDHAATTPMRPEAVAAMLPFLAGPRRQPVGRPRRRRGRRRPRSRRPARTSPSVLGCAPGRGRVHRRRQRGRQPRGEGRRPGPRAARPAPTASSPRAIEHKARARPPCDRLEREGFRVAAVGVDRGRRASTSTQLAAALDDRTAVVSVMLVNNETGTSSRSPRSPRWSATGRPQARPAHRRGAGGAVARRRAAPRPASISSRSRGTSSAARRASARSSCATAWSSCR